MSVAKFDQFAATVYAALAPAGTTIEAMLSYCIVVFYIKFLGGKSKAQGWMEIFYGGFDFSWR